MKLQTGLVAFFAFGAFISGTLPVSAQVSLGTAQSFSVLGGTTVTNTGTSAITGNVGVSPGTAVVGFPPGVIAGGSIQAGNAVAGQAQTDLTVAYNAVAGTACNVNLTGQNLGGLTLTPGVYCFDSSAFLTGILSLDFQGNPNSVFLFKTGSTLITAVGSSVVLINSGGTACPPNLFWQVGSSATLGTGSIFIGNILALTSITLNTSARLSGRALARNGAVTLDTNTVALCAPVIICPVVTVNPATLPNGAVGVPYSQTVSGSGGAAPYTFALTSGALPNGLLLNMATGAITGSPLTIGTFNFTITATDANGCPGSRAYSIIIAAAACPVITVNPATLPSGNIGLAYNQTISATGGAAPYTFTLAAGALPNGLTLSPAGAITGTPTTAGLFSFTVRATDVNGCPGSRPYSIAIAAVCPLITVTPTLLPPATVGRPYNQTLTATGGVAPYSFLVTAGALPAGLLLNSATGVLSGTPLLGGSAGFTITVLDANGCPGDSGTRPFSLNVFEVAIPTLDFFGMMMLVALVAAAGLFAIKRA